MKEKFFVFHINEDGTLDGVEWFDTENDARKASKLWKQQYSADAPDVYIAELLV